MSNNIPILSNIQPIKQLLNFAEKECEEYDISEIEASIRAMNGNSIKLINIKMFIQVDNKKDIFKFFLQKNKKSAIKKRMILVINSLITNKRDNN